MTPRDRFVMAGALGLLLLTPVAAAAQDDPRFVPLLRIGVGVTDLPDPIVETCGGNPTALPTAQLAGGVRRARWTAEIQLEATSSLAVTDCLSLPIYHVAGTHTDQLYPYDRGHGDAAASAHLRYGPPDGFWDVGVGAGRFRSARTPFLVAAATVHTRGRLAAVAELQGRWTRIDYDLVTAEWTNAEVVRELSRDSGMAWHRAIAFRLGAELRFR